MEGQALKSSKTKDAKDVQAKAPEQPKSELAATVVTEASAATSYPAAYLGDLSCTVIKDVCPPPKDLVSSTHQELAALAANITSTILDSGTSSHLLKDRHVFWSYEPTQAHDMTTANQGVLWTMASGDCYIRLTLGDLLTVVKLCDCLHAPQAAVNLLSVG